MGRSFKENNFKNLIETAPEEQREIARQGGYASGISKRKKKKQAQALGALMEAAFTVQFATPEEMEAFLKWRKNKEKRDRRTRKNKHS